MKKWDVFISHASEDKQTVALPLAESLVRAGLKVWLDRFELRVGDSLREKIDEGLSESAFGVVILSEHFLSKGWPKKELNGLFALEEDGVKVILPVWHELDKATVARYSPILADRLAANTKDGIPLLARTIAQVVLEEVARVRQGGATLVSQFVEILKQGPSSSDVSTFLTTYPGVLPMALGHFGMFPEDAFYRVRPNLGGIQPDLAIGNPRSTFEGVEWRHFFFSPLEGPFFEQGIPTGALKQAIEKLEYLQHWLSNHAVEAVRILLPTDRREEPDWHSGVILASQRDHLSDSDRESMRSLRDRGIEIRSYDWLIEACAMVEQASAKSSDMLSRAGTTDEL